MKRAEKNNAAHRSVRPEKPLKTFIEILRFMKKYAWHIVFAILAGIVNVGSMLVGNMFLRELLSVIETFVGGGAGFDESMALLMQNTGIMLAVYFAGAAGGFVSMRLLLTVSTGTLYSVRTKMFEKMERLPISYFDKRTHGEIMSRYTTDTDALREMISNGIPNIVSSVLTIIGVFVLMMVYSPLLTVFVIVMLAVMIAAVAIIGGKGGKYFILQQAGIARANGYIEEYVEGQKVVQVFCHEEKTKAGFKTINDDLCRQETSAQTFAQITSPI